MILFFQIIIVICVYLLVHSYLIYPLHLLLLNSLRKKKNSFLKSDTYSLPFVSCIISVYNEAGIVCQKIRSVLESEYPNHKILLYIGSDASTDDSNRLIHQMSMEDQRIHFYQYQQRRGKAIVINDLVEEAFKNKAASNEHVLLFTDANVILSPVAIINLCKHFQDSKMALVDSKIIPTNLRPQGISFSENQYMSLEIKLKHLEGELWGAMMGAFGGCFALRSDFFEKVPSRFLVDDFFISMNALRKGGSCKNELEAICYEGMPDQLKEEFRRKARISAGNFQNLSVFYTLLFKKPFIVGYAFFSHKVLRWIGPLMIITIWISSTSLVLIDFKHFIIQFAFITFLLFVLPIFDFILGKLGLHFKILRGIRYFILMNIALLIGFINYIKGIRNSSWEPPKRSI